MASRSYLFLVAGLLVLPACPLLDVEADVQQTCATYHDVKVDAEPAGETGLTKAFTYDDLGPLKDLAGLDATLPLTHSRVRVTGGIGDFGFVQHASIMVASGDPSSTLPTLELDCTDCGGATQTLDITSSPAIDIKDYISSASLAVTIDLAGPPPTVPWTMDVDVCVTGKVSYTASL